MITKRGQRAEGAFKEIGYFVIDPCVYIDVFGEARKHNFQENAELSKQFSLDY